MTINKKYGILNSKNEFEYAPKALKTNSGTILNPPEKIYLKYGYYKVINNKPEAESNCYVKFTGYEKNDEEKTITFVYVQQMIPTTRTYRKISKLYLQIALTKLDMWDQFIEYLNSYTIDLGEGKSIKAIDAYNNCLVIDESDPLFEPELKKAKEYFGLDDETYEKIIESCIAKE